MTQWSLLAVAAALLASCNGGVSGAPSEPSGEPSTPKEESVQSTPVTLVKAFFEAMAADDRETMSRLMTPERAERMKDAEAWDGWLALWKRFTVLRIGDVLEEREADGSLPGSVKVRVEYGDGERTFQDSVSVSQIDGLWYWDEN